MSLDVFLTQVQETEVYSSNITHNLNKMASQAGLYHVLWHPETLGVARAGELIPLLRGGLNVLLSDPDYFKSFNPENSWGTYDGLVKFVREYINACETYPNAKIGVSR